MSRQNRHSTVWSEGTVFVYASLLMIALQVLVILLSWILNAIRPELDFHSLLSGEGLRLMLASYLENISDSALGIIILLSVGCGSIVKSGLSKVLKHPGKLDFRHRFALQMCLVEAVLSVAVALYVIFLPHSPMLSITGHYFPGPLLYCIVPYLTIVMMLLSYTYSFFGGNLLTMSQVSEIATYGIKKCAWLIVMYLIMMELIVTVSFVMA